MNTILSRFLALTVFAMTLGFLANSGIIIEENSLFVVGRATYSVVNQIEEEPVAACASGYAVVAQVELVASAGQANSLRVDRVYSVKTDKNGYFMIKNASDRHSYVLLGVKPNANLPFRSGFASIIMPQQQAGKVISFGHHQFELAEESGVVNCRKVSLNRDVSNSEFMSYFINQSGMNNLVHRFCDRTGNWSGRSQVTILDSHSIELVGAENAEWISI